MIDYSIMRSPLLLLVFISSSIYSEEQMVAAPTAIKQNLNSAIFCSAYNQWIAVGDSGTILYSGPPGQLWSSRKNTGTAERLNGVTWTGLQLVAVGDHGTVLTSPGGAHWTVHPQDPSDSLVTLKSVTWTGTQLVAVGNGKRSQPDPSGSYDCGVIWTSSDGNTWEKYDGYTRLYQVIWTGSQIVMGGTRWVPGGDAIHGSHFDVFTSTKDFKNWSSTGTGVGYFINSISWSGLKYVVSGWGETGLFFSTSSDGITWEPYRFQSTPDRSRPWPWGCSISTTWSLWPTARFVTVADTEVYVSSTGLSWTVWPSDNSNKLNFVTYSNLCRKTVAVGEKGTILISMPVADIDKNSQHRSLTHENTVINFNRVEKNLSISKPQAFSGVPYAATIYSIDGRISGSWDFISGGDKVVLPLTNISKGIYFVHLHSNKVSCIKQFTVY